ncbi:MAG: glycoside hydrolase family protein [Rhizobacter sp.]
MKPLASAAVALGMAVAQAQPAAADKALDTASLLRETEAAVRLAGGLDVKSNEPALREGQALVLTIALPRSGYLNVVSINPAGEPTVLFPNQVQSDNKVEAGTFKLPTPQMPFILRAAAPFGSSLVAAFLTQEPLNLYATGEGARNTAGALIGQFARLSAAGRDLIDALGTKSLVVEPKAAPMLAGMTRVLTCAAAGPCTAEAPTGTSPLLRILDALTPGILLEPEAPIDKALALRPVYDKGIKLTKVSEGFVSTLYEDAAGYCSVAYGHLLKRARCGPPELSHYRGGISEPEGGRLLVTDMARAQRAVMQLVKADLSDGQFAALCDFTYNVGSGNLKRSTLLKAVNNGEHHRVPSQLRRWSKAGGKEFRGLKTRREREIALYFEGQTIPKSIPVGEDESPIDVRVGEPGS